MTAILLTGGTGHLGRHLMPLLRDAILLGRSGSCDLRADLADPAALEPHADRLATIEILVHAAHPMVGAPPESDEAPGLVDASALALARLLGKLPALRRVVHVSSTAAERPADVYGVTKRLEEDLLRLHCDDRGIALATLRISSIYGPRATRERALARFLRTALAGQTPVVRGADGPGTDYVHVEDAARAVALAATGDATGVLHVTGNEETTPLRAAKLALRAAGRGDVEPIREPGPAWRGGGAIDNDDAARALGWTPRYDLANGLGSYAEWLRASPA
jgi:nucleoside-diphosphate-sugar epimerase